MLCKTMLHVVAVSGFVEVSSPSVCLNEFQTTEYVFCLIVVSCDVYERTLGGFGMISSYGLSNRLVFGAKVTWQRDSAVFQTSASANTDTLLFIEFFSSFFRAYFCCFDFRSGPHHLIYLSSSFIPAV